MDERRATGLRLHHPLESHRVGLGEVAAFDDDAVGILHVHEAGGRATAAEGRSHAGDGRAVAQPGLVLHLDDAQGRPELLDEVVLLVVQRRAAEVGDAHRAVGAVPVQLLLPGLPARLDDPVGHHVQRLVQRQPFPVRAVRAAVQDVVAPGRAGGQLERAGALRAESSAVDRRVRIALDLDDLLVLDVHVLGAADPAVWADGFHDPVGGGGARLQRGGRGRLRRDAAAERVAFPALAQDGPLADELLHSVPSGTTSSFALPLRFAGRSPSVSRALSSGAAAAAASLLPAGACGCGRVGAVRSAAAYLPPNSASCSGATAARTFRKTESSNATCWPSAEISSSTSSSKRSSPPSRPSRDCSRSLPCCSCSSALSASVSPSATASRTAGQKYCSSAASWRDRRIRIMSTMETRRCWCTSVPPFLLAGMASSSSMRYFTWLWSRPSRSMTSSVSSPSLRCSIVGGSAVRSSAARRSGSSAAVRPLIQARTLSSSVGTSVGGLARC